MKLSKKYSPELLTGGRNYPAITQENCYLDLNESPCVVATNGMSLVSVPVEKEDEDTQGLIPATAIRGAKKISGKADQIRIRANSHVEIPEILTMFERPDAAKFPDWRKVRPSTPGSAKIAFNPFLLVELAKAMGADEKTIIELQFDPAPNNYTGNVITIRLNDCEAEGYLMRGRMEGK